MVQLVDVEHCGLEISCWAQGIRAQGLLDVFVLVGA